MNIKKNIRNELLKRQEVLIKLESDKNPGFSEARKKISEEFSKPEENIEVYNVKSNFGRNIFLIHAYIYDSKADLEKTIQKTKKQRDAEKKAEEEAKKTNENLSTSEESKTE